LNVAAGSPWAQVFGFSVLDHVPVGSCVLNSRLEVVFWNKVLERWTGIDRWDILQHGITEFFPHFGQPQYRFRLDDIFRGGPPLVLSSQLHGQIFPSVCSDGKPRLQQTTVTGIPTHDGSGCLACLAVEDVSEVTRRIADLKETRDKAEALAAEARRANTAKSQFLANMSHELRTPLNSILLLSGMMVEDPDNGFSEGDRNSAQIINQSGKALLELVNDILDLAKAEAGRTELIPEQVDLESFLQDLEGATGLLVKHKGLEFRVEVEQDAPPVFVTDRQALSQIIRNLVSNAAKFTQEGRVALKVAVESPEWLAPEGAAGRWLAISVSDTGPGIAPERQEAVFEPFCQEDGTTSREFGGTGLGLSISRQLAELMGGRLVLDSRPGEGCTFTLYLPPNLPDRSTGETLPNRKPRAAVAVPGDGEPENVRRNRELAVIEEENPVDLDPERLAGRRILVTDDDMRCLYTISGILESVGAEVLTAVSGQDALDKLEQNPDVDLVLMDLGMPDMNGLETLGNIRGRISWNDLPVLCMAGQDPASRCRNCRTCLAAGSLTKPFPRQGLIEIIERSLPEKVPAGC